MFIRTMVLGSALAMLVACDGKKPAAGEAPAPVAGAPEAPVEKKPEAKPISLDISLDIGAAMMAKDPDDSGWKGISIKAPTGAIVDVSPGGTMIKIDDNMSIGLGGEKDIAEKKKNAQSSSLQTFKRFVVEEPNAFLYETADGNFLFIANVKLGEDKVKSCQTEGFGKFNQQAAEKLFEACKGLTLAAQ